MSKGIIGVTVGTSISPISMEDRIKPVKSVNGVVPDENGNVTAVLKTTTRELFFSGNADDFENHIYETIQPTWLNTTDDFDFKVRFSVSNGLDGSKTYEFTKADCVIPIIGNRKHWEFYATVEGTSRHILTVASGTSIFGWESNGSLSFYYPDGLNDFSLEFFKLSYGEPKFVTSVNGVTPDYNGNVDISVIQGEKGDKGDQGEKGDTGAQGPKGEQGIQGEKGDTGAQGPKGDTGAKGDKGDKGTGVSSVSLVNGQLVITLSDTTSINLGNVIGAKGDKGDKGDTGAQGEQGIQGEKGDKGEQGIQGIQGETGAQGPKGDTGAKGQDGEDGVGISDVTITAEGNLKITFTTGVTTDLGNIKGADGESGVGIDEIFVQDGNLYVKKTTDSTAVSLGSIKGDKGDKGDTGEQGPQGIQGPQGEQGPKGDKGDKGDTGEQGPAGTNGVDGKSAYELYKQAHPEYTGTLEDWLNSLKGETGRGILRTEFSGTNFIVYYTDGTSETHDLSDMFGDPNEREVLVFSKLSDGTYGVMAGGMAKYEVVITIPASYNDIPVTQILSNGFKDLTALQEIKMPNSIKVIGKNAFQDCINLNNIILPNELKEINEYAFNGCISLKSNVIIPETTKLIGKYAFYNTGITSVTLVDNIGWTTEPIPYTYNGTRDYTSIISSTSSKMTDFKIDYVVSSVHTGTLTYTLTPTSVATAFTQRVHRYFNPYLDWDYYWHFDAYKYDWYNTTAVEVS